ncbi:hypothetical protein AB6T85_23610 [Erwinia sp. ACCC 02193]|uniref:Uncharacterized protein n=1 Tax=Erwinia aeris TaxID=3239803 RepID=A0ABV4EEN0_9GAMM
MNIETKLGHLAAKFDRRYHSEYSALVSGKKPKAKRPTEEEWLELLQLQHAVTVELLTSVKSLAHLHRRLIIWKSAELQRLLWLQWSNDKEESTGWVVAASERQACQLHTIARRNLFARQKAQRQAKTTSASKVLQ